MKLSVTKPYLIGFNHSRQEHPDAFTHGPDPNPEQRDYSHPEYLQDEKRYRYFFDYYSLGLVLLEIGLWRSLSSMVSTMKDDEDQSPEALKKFLLKKYVPKLGSAIGQIYVGVVLACLKSEFESQSSSAEIEDKDSTLALFEERVVIPLRTCKA
jgi:hypothetical protein